ncbi:aminotransferase class IV [Fibrella aestuarina]|nr:aminotransferase class IV [Fibrella aestuarina]
MNLVYNSDVLPASHWMTPPTDRAFQYGDGLFETIRYEKNRVWFWPDHYDRLRQGMAALQLNVPTQFDSDTLHEQVMALIHQNELADGSARIKLQVWRQTGGLYTPTTRAANWLLTAQPTSPFTVTAKAHLGFFTAVRLVSSPVSRFKTLNALPYVLAGLHRQQHGYDDVILLDTAGHVAECMASSVFWRHNGQWFTPSLDTGCIDGILRRQLLRTQVVEEGLYAPETLATADAVFCANVNGIQTFGGTSADAITPLLHLIGLGAPV